MTRESVVERIAAFNRGRDPERLALKYRAMRANPLAFLRGTCHLFYDALPRARVLRDAPATWICGDLHVENFGTYKADNRQVYFDLNDFDEGALAPCTWDLLRLVVSVLVATRYMGLRGKERRILGSALLDSYANALTLGKARWVERETARGLVRDLLDNVRHRNRKTFMDSRTTSEHGKCRLLIDGKHTLAASRGDYRRVMAFARDLARTQADRPFFRPLDVARHIAGTGSLGIERWLLLVEGHGPSAGHSLLDLKHQPPPALRPYLTLKQPRWKSEADRVVQIQRRAQAIAPAFLTSVSLDGEAFVLKEAQPVSDKITLIGRDVKSDELQRLVVTLGELVAWSHLRTGGRQGSAIADELIAFGGKTGWRRDVLRLADEMVHTVYENWHTFRRANL